MDLSTVSREWKIAAATLATATALAYAIKSTSDTKSHKDNIPTAPGRLPFFGKSLPFMMMYPSTTSNQDDRTSSFYRY